MDNPSMSNLPPYRPSMAIIYRRVHAAFRAHWKEHENKPPQKLILTAAQADDLLLCRQYGQVAFPGATPPRRDKFQGRPIEVSDSTPGEIVAHDGAVIPLSDDDRLE